MIPAVPPGDAVYRAGARLLIGGVWLTALSLGLSVAGMKVGLILGLIGLTLMRSWPSGLNAATCWGLLGSAWMVAAVALTAAVTGAGPWFEKTGVLYTWLALPVTLAAIQTPIAPPGMVRRTAWRLVLVGAAAAWLLGSIQYLTGYAVERPIFHLSGDGIRHDRISGFFAHHYPFAMMLTLIAVAGAGLGTTRLGRWLTWGMALSGGILSASRSVLVALPLALVVERLSLRPAAWRRALAVGLGLTLVGGGLLWLAAAAYVEEILHLRSGRFYIWDLTCQVIASHPWSGAGGQARYAAECLALLPVKPAELPEAWWFAQGPPHAHNTFLTLAGWYGLPAVVCHLGFLAGVVGLLRQRSGPAARAAGLAILGLVVGAGFLEFTIGDAETAAACFTLLGLLGDDRDATDPGH